MEDKDLIYIERDIVTGMIISTAYIKQVKEIIDLEWVQAKEAKILMQWCLEYYTEHKAAPKRNIEKIFLDKISGMQQATAELIEQILDNLSETIEGKEEFNISYLKKQTIKYCTACKITGFADQAKDMVENDDLHEAQSLLSSFKPVELIQTTAVSPLANVRQIKNAFLSQSESLIRYSGALGTMLNTAMVKEGFVTFLAQNKGGKSFHLLKAAMLAAHQGKKVAFFQAGDMSQAQQERRIAINLLKRSDLPQYTKALHIPILDCFWNQNGDCDEDQREDPDIDACFNNDNNPGEQDNFNLKWLKEKLSKKHIEHAMEEFPDHKPCYECLRHRHLRHKFQGSIWYRIKPACDPLTWKMAYKYFNHKRRSKYYQKIFGNLKLITYSSDMLTMSKIDMELDLLKKQNFHADIVIIDYLDLCASDLDVKMMKPRDQENMKWKRARQLSQERKILVLSASQSDAQGFTTKVLNKTNFSEDRRKLDHVTAMFGLNMNNREKVLGLMRINDIVSRDTEGANIVTVMHRLQIGQPILGSYY